jgi:hypothetical protein
MVMQAIQRRSRKSYAKVAEEDFMKAFCDFCVPFATSAFKKDFA